MAEKDLKPFNKIIKEPETEMTAEKHYNNFVAIIEDIKRNADSRFEKRIFEKEYKHNLAKYTKALKTDCK